MDITRGASLAPTLYALPCFASLSSRSRVRAGLAPALVVSLSPPL
jgi:hypothetical protein